MSDMREDGFSGTLHRRAKWVLGLGIGSVLCGVTALPAVILGHVTLFQMARETTTVRTRRMVIAGLVLGYLALAIATASIVLPLMARQREALRQARCASNLKRIGGFVSNFADQSEGNVYPRVSTDPYQLYIADVQPESPHGKMVPNHIPDLELFVCPSDIYTPILMPGQLPDGPYWYVGYAFANQEELEALHAAWMKSAKEGFAFDTDIPVEAGTGTAGGDAILRLRKGVEEVYAEKGITDEDGNPVTAASIPLMIEHMGADAFFTYFNHVPGGSHVLFLDGHVEFVKYPGWPITVESVQLLNEMHEVMLTLE
jgi:prepilin-type processing-associated H-X9-DG protein